MPTQLSLCLPSKVNGWTRDLIFHKKSKEMKNHLQISNYVIETVLGQGTFGSVYLVRRKKDSKPFVIKKQALGSQNSQSFEITLGEVRSLQRMRHPNIVAYHGAWVEDSHSYILMEYATKCTLKDLLEKRECPLEGEDALYLFAQIVLGVHHIHCKKILHRDLKPENILLTGTRGDIVKIGDFGVSKNLQELRNRRIMCRAGSFYYMAPEMLTGQSYDFKSDIWSMGVILYEMVTKTLPFPALNIEEIIRKVTQEKPKPFECVVSPSIVKITSKMLMKEASARPRIDQLVLCPDLIPVITRVYLNLGRTPNVFKTSIDKVDKNFFLRFLKPNSEL